MRIAIRMDDITPGMDWEKFNRFRKILDGGGIRPLIGVVPRVQDPKLRIDEEKEDFWEWLAGLKKDGWHIAMHGLNHVYRTDKGGMFPLNRQSEFAGLPYEEQLAMLKEGKSLLKEKGIETDIFMAPSHSYDRNTLRALKAAGFKAVTDGFGSRPYIRGEEGLIFYPVSFRKEADLSSAADGITTFVVHANTMSDRAFEWYEELVGSGRAVSFDEMTAMPAQKEPFLHQALEYTMAKGKYLGVRAGALAKGLRGRKA